MTTNTESKKALAEEIFGNLDTGEMVQLWNEYCEACNYTDDMIFYMDDFNEFMYGLKPDEIARRIHFGKFNPMDDYFWFDGYGNLETGSHARYFNSKFKGDIDIYPYDMVEWYIATKE